MNAHTGLNRRRGPAYDLGRCLAGFGLLCMLSACSSATPRQAAAPVPSTPTVPATVVHESTADAQSAMEVVQEFEDALHRRDELVALLLLTPDAQQRVAASSLDSFVEPAWQTNPTGECDVRVQDDTAAVTCSWRLAKDLPRLRITMIRLNGAWKIDRARGQ